MVTYNCMRFSVFISDLHTMDRTFTAGQIELVTVVPMFFRGKQLLYAQKVNR